MGAKYLPSIKDQRAAQRFQQKQLRQSKFIKPKPAAPPAPAKQDRTRADTGAR